MTGRVVWPGAQRSVLAVDPREGKMADYRFWCGATFSAFSLAACSRAMLTAELVIIGGKSDVIKGLTCTSGDLLLPIGCNEFPSLGVTSGCMLGIGTWNRSSR